MPLQDDINNFGSSNTAADLLVLAATLANTSNDRIISVATVNDLPDLKNNTIQPGTIIYVESINVPVVAQIDCWTGLDNRQLRNDYYLASIWGWGDGQLGRLADGNTINRSSPVSVIGGFTDWCQVSGGISHTLALRSNGTLWSWGSGSSGRLGDGTTISKSSPVSVIGGITDWCQVSARTFHNLAIRSNGTLWSWGTGSQGRLGDGTIINKSSPVSVVGGFTDWCQVGVGTNHSVAIRSNGTIWSWGYNCCGSLGDGTTINRSSPVSVVGGFTDWCQVTAGIMRGSSTPSFSLAIRSNGTLWSWGNNVFGQLGDGTYVSRNSPVSVIGGFTDWCQVSAGYHSLALRSNGTLWSWGYNEFGALGDGTYFPRKSPVSVIGGFTDWCQIGTGIYHSLAIRSNGTLWSWGNNSAGQQGALGDGTVITRSSPVSVVGGFTDWCQASGGTSRSFAIRKTS
jgi:hypothetical protein